MFTIPADRPCRTLVIGGSGRLGSAVCRELAASGHRLALTWHRGEERARALSAEIAGPTGSPPPMIPLDLGDTDEVVSAIQTAARLLEGLDSLVVTSGLATGQPWTGKQPDLFEITQAGFDRMLTVNLRGIFFACQEAARIMKADSGGRIVLTGSIDGIKTVPSPPDYACCKAALWGLTQSLSKELGPHGILVNLVAPGILEGGIADLLDRKLMADYLRHSALRRVGTFDEVARVIVFLASPGNTYVTGQAVPLDGGL